MRVEITFAGNPQEAVVSAEAVSSALKSLGLTATATKGQLLGMSGASDTLAVSSTRAGAAHRQHAKDINEADRSARGAIASFTGLGRAMTFASTAFLGGALVGGALKQIVDQTRAAGDAQAQLRTVVTNTGASWGIYGSQTRGVISAQSDLSKFTTTELTQALTKLVLSTGSVTKGESALALTTNLARAAHEDLATAETQLANIQAGRVTVLRGLGISTDAVTTAQQALKTELAQLKANHEQLTPAELAHAQALATTADHAATAAKMIDLVRQKTQGADAAFGKTSAGSLADFHRTLDDFEIAIGKGILPDLTQLIDEFTIWLDHLEKTGAAQRDAKQAADALRGAISTLRDIIHDVDGVTGSFKHTLELLSGLLIAFKVDAFVAGMAAIGTGATVATGEITVLRAALLSLGSPAVIAALAAAALGGYTLGEALFGGSNGGFGTPAAKAAAAGKNYATNAQGQAVDLSGNVIKPGGHPYDIHGKHLTNETVGKNGSVTAKFDYPLASTGKIIGEPYQGTHGKAFNVAGGSDNWESENAVDIAVKQGTVVVAVEDGVIGQQIGSLGSGGRFAGLRLHLLGDSGNEYYYAHLSTISVKAGQRVKKGDALGFSGSANGVAHLHFAQKTGNPNATISGGAPIPSGIAPPKPGTGSGGNGGNGGNGADAAFQAYLKWLRSHTQGTPQPFAIPKPLQLAIAKASTTPGTGDDATALKSAIAWIKSNVSGMSTDDQISAYTELAGLLGQLKSIAKKVVHAKASKASLISAQGLASTLAGDLATNPFAGIVPETPEQTNTSLTTALGTLASVKATYGPKVKAAAAEIQKGLTDDTMSAAALSTLRARMAQWQKIIDTATAAAKTAAQNAASVFQSIWSTMAQDALTEFDKVTQDWVSPAQLLINQLQDQHDTDALNKALDQANTDLATALQGHAQDAQAQLDSIRQYVGQQFLANAIDAAQSAILGGPSSQTSSSSILSTLQGLLAGGNVVDPTEVANAQQEVEDAKYNIQIAGLQKTATAQQAAWDAQRAAQRIALQNMADDWGTYYTQVGGNIDKIKQLWITALAAIDPAAAAALGSGYDQTGAPSAAVINSNNLASAIASGASQATIVAAARAAGYTQSVGALMRAGDIPGFANGADFITSGPTRFMAGEGAHRERVTVTPIRDGSYGTPTGAGHVHVHVHTRDEALADFINVQVDGATSRISRSQGIAADTRRRAGNF